MTAPRRGPAPAGRPSEITTPTSTTIDADPTAPAVSPQDVTADAWAAYRLGHQVDHAVDPDVLDVVVKLTALFGTCELWDVE